MSYDVVAGRISTWSLEAHVVDHCNLRCANCCTLSPALPERFTSPAELARDLGRAARVLAPAVFKLTGGEPLLHPELPALLAAARASKISPVISITTNGHLAPRVDPAVWRLVDRVTLSHYSSAPLPAKTLAFLEEQPGLQVKWIDSFQVLDGEGHDPAEVFARCWLKVRCHLVHRGCFYMCTRPPHLLEEQEDGVELDDRPDLLRRIHAYLERDEPLASCARCLGASGPHVPHVQLRVRDGKDPSGRPPAAGSR